MKRCLRCQEWKDKEAFAWENERLGQRQKYCRDCMRDFNRASRTRKKQGLIPAKAESHQRRRETLRRYIWDYLATHPCVDCGERDPVVLEFDHVNPALKAGNVADLVARGVALETLQAEIAKCEVCCVNCHRIKTHTERGWPR